MGLVSKIGAIFLPSLPYSNSSSKQPFRFGATSPNLPALLQLQTYAHFSSWGNFSKSTGFAPTPDICPLFLLEQLLQIYRLCSNSRHMPTFFLGTTSPNPPALLQFPCPILHQKGKNPWHLPRGFVYSLKTDISSAFICFLLVSITTCKKSFVHFFNNIWFRKFYIHKGFCTFLAFGAKKFFQTRQNTKKIFSNPANFTNEVRGL